MALPVSSPVGLLVAVSPGSSVDAPWLVLAAPVVGRPLPEVEVEVEVEAGVGVDALPWPLLLNAETVVSSAGPAPMPPQASHPDTRQPNRRISHRIEEHRANTALCQLSFHSVLTLFLLPAASTRPVATAIWAERDRKLEEACEVRRKRRELI